MLASNKERIESLKAGVVAAMATAIASLTTFWLVPGIGNINLWDGAIGTAAAFVSGFLFGATYRYAIRADGNAHLKAGVVLAFALVRGLALTDPQAVWQSSGAMLESLLWFGIAGIAVEWGMKVGR